MNVSNKRIRVENWLKKNRNHIRSKTIDNELQLKGAITHFYQEGRKINDKRINVLFKFIKKFTVFNLKTEYKREQVENWLRKNQKYIVRSSIDKELTLKNVVRHFLYNGRKINSDQINQLYQVVKKISQF